MKPVILKYFPRAVFILVSVFIYSRCLPAMAIDLANDFSGELKTYGSLSRSGGDTFKDGRMAARLKNKTCFDNWGDIDIHYEAVWSGGDTRKNLSGQSPSTPGPIIDTVYADLVPDDDRRLMDLTHVIHEADREIIYQRLDRLCLTLQPKWGTVRIGRQALTWGNGRLFNPMDLFNPFAPTDIDREYKTGDDMLMIDTPGAALGGLQVLYVPRRDPEDGKVKWESSSLAGKLHLSHDTTEYDLMMAAHYGDLVCGLGSRGYIKDAAWRLDATWTVKDDDEKKGVVAAVAGLDYSWVWWGKNIYGLIEGYANSLGRSDAADAVTHKALSDRLARGEMFTTGPVYGGAEIQVELHPLVNLYVTGITNMADYSGVIQPWLAWDAAENLQVILGANAFYGASGTEYGGFDIPGTGIADQPANSLFAWITGYF